MTFMGLQVFILVVSTFACTHCGHVETDDLYSKHLQMLVRCYHVVCIPTHLHYFTTLFFLLLPIFCALKMSNYPTLRCM